MVALKENSGDLIDHPTVKLRIGVPAGQKVLHRLGVLDLQVEIALVLLGHSQPELSRADLRVDLRDLIVCRLQLEIPFFQPAGKLALEACQAR